MNEGSPAFGRAVLAMSRENECDDAFHDVVILHSAIDDEIELDAAHVYP